MVGVEAKVVNVNKVVETGTPTLVRINKQIGAYNSKKSDFKNSNSSCM